MKIYPSVMVDGQTVYPPGWMYILAFAIKGVPWAIKEIENNAELREMIDKNISIKFPIVKVSF